MRKIKVGKSFMIPSENINEDNDKDKEEVSTKSIHILLTLGPNGLNICSKLSSNYENIFLFLTSKKNRLA